MESAKKNENGFFGMLTFEGIMSKMKMNRRDNLASQSMKDDLILSKSPDLMNQLIDENTAEKIEDILMQSGADVADSQVNKTISAMVKNNEKIFDQENEMLQKIEELFRPKNNEKSLSKTRTRNQRRKEKNNKSDSDNNQKLENESTDEDEHHSSGGQRSMSDDIQNTNSVNKKMINKLTRNLKFSKQSNNFHDYVKDPNSSSENSANSNTDNSKSKNKNQSRKNSAETNENNKIQNDTDGNAVKTETVTIDQKETPTTPKHKGLKRFIHYRNLEHQDSHGNEINSVESNNTARIFSKESSKMFVKIRPVHEKAPSPSRNNNELLNKISKSLKLSRSNSERSSPRKESAKVENENTSPFFSISNESTPTKNENNLESWKPRTPPKPPTTVATFRPQIPARANNIVKDDSIVIHPVRKSNSDDSVMDFNRSIKNETNYDDSDWDSDDSVMPRKIHVNIKPIDQMVQSSSSFNNYDLLNKIGKNLKLNITTVKVNSGNDNVITMQEKSVALKFPDIKNNSQTFMINSTQSTLSKKFDKLGSSPPSIPPRPKLQIPPPLPPLPANFTLNHKILFSNNVSK